jgi:DNA-binding SARP family transcriptional activator
MNEHGFTLRLLGGFRLDQDRRGIGVPLSSQRLLGYLALQDGPLARSFVAATLWPETTDEKAAANLRTALWRLHRPDGSLIDATGSQLGLSADVWCDVRAIRAAARRLRQHGGLPADDLLIDARGELLPGCWDSWVVFERERLRQELAHLCESACARDLTGCDWHRGLLHALAAVECDPLRESANVWVLRAHLAAGNRSAAVRHARGYAALLHDELGIDPPSAAEDLVWSRPVTPLAVRSA